MTIKKRLVVVGNGMAGARLVEDIITCGGREQYDIVMFGEEPYGNYNRILLSSVLAGGHDQKDIFINPLAWYEENGVTLHAGMAAYEIDRTAKVVRALGDVVEPYDTLVIATGSRAFVPPMRGLEAREAGGWLDGICVFRTLDDCDRIVALAANAKKAAVIGGGLLGLEAARGLLSMGLEVHVVHLKDHVMEMQLDRPAGLILQRSLEKIGLIVHLEKATTAVLGGDRVTGLEFADGTTLDCDMVVLSAGVRANIDLAKRAGLTVERAIVVGDDLACANDPDIYAVGECAQHRNVVYGLVAPVWEQTSVLADRLTGRRPRAVYEGSRTSTKLKVMGIDLTVMGDREPVGVDDEIATYAEAARGIYKKLIVREGRLAGAILVGDSAAAPDLLQAFHRGSSLPDDRSQLLFPQAAGASSVGAADLPDSAQICNCNGVSKGAITSAVKAGARTLAMLTSYTRAGTGCGSCKPQVQQILEVASDGLVAPDPAAHYYVPGVPLTKPDLIAAIREHRLKSVSSVFAVLASGREDAASKPGLASLLKTVWAGEYDDERDARFINDRVHANIQKDGTFSVVPRIYGGVTSAAELRRIADVADKYAVPMVKITGGQRIDLLGLTREQLPDVWRDLGIPSGHAYTKAFRTCKTCVGTEFCRYGVGDSTGLGIKIEQRFQGIESPHKMKLATAGCPRNCSEATTKDLGAVAIEGGRWEVYIGGAAGSRVRKGDVLCVVDTHDEVLRIMGRFMQYYRENAKYLERTYDFAERVGIERLRELLVNDVERIAARLDASIDEAVAAYKDPWRESELPVHPIQFVGLLDPASVAS